MTDPNCMIRNLQLNSVKRQNQKHITDTQQEETNENLTHMFQSYRTGNR